MVVRDIKPLVIVGYNGFNGRNISTHIYLCCQISGIAYIRVGSRAVEVGKNARFILENRKL